METFARDTLTPARYGRLAGALFLIPSWQGRAIGRALPVGVTGRRAERAAECGQRQRQAGRTRSRMRSRTRATCPLARAHAIPLVRAAARSHTPIPYRSPSHPHQPRSTGHGPWPHPLGQKSTEPYRWPYDWGQHLRIRSVHYFSRAGEQGDLGARKKSEKVRGAGPQKWPQKWGRNYDTMSRLGNGARPGPPALGSEQGIGAGARRSRWWQGPPGRVVRHYFLRLGVAWDICVIL